MYWIPPVCVRLYGFRTGSNGESRILWIFLDTMTLTWDPLYPFPKRCWQEKVIRPVQTIVLKKMSTTLTFQHYFLWTLKIVLVTDRNIYTQDKEDKNASTEVHTNSGKADVQWLKSSPTSTGEHPFSTFDEITVLFIPLQKWFIAWKKIDISIWGDMINFSHMAVNLL